MSKVNRHWHEGWSFIASISKHHPLITCSYRFDLFVCRLTLFCFQGFVYTHCNIGGLVCYGNLHTTGVTVKAFLTSVIPNIQYDFPYQLVKIEKGIGCDLSHDDDESCLSRRFACYT